MTTPAPARPTEPAAFHRLPHTLGKRSTWWRPLVACAVAAVAFPIMFALLMIAVLVVSVIWPALAPSESLMDPLNPVDQFTGLAMLALLIPAVLIGCRIGFGRAGIAHSVLGRFRWGLLGRAGLVILPVYVLLNSVLNLVIERDSIVVPELTASVIVAWVFAVVLSPLQSAGEEYVFRALPMQVFGTWLRWPGWGIIVPIPLFVMGHGYDWVGMIHLVIFSVLMGMLIWKTGGIELAVLMHAANNLTLFAIAPLLPGLVEQGAVSFLEMVVATVPVIVLTAGLWWWYSRREGLTWWEPSRKVASSALPTPEQQASREAAPAPVTAG